MNKSHKAGSSIKVERGRKSCTSTKDEWDMQLDKMISSVYIRLLLFTIIEKIGFHRSEERRVGKEC